MKFLIDECLSPELVKRAHARGYGESSHVAWRHLHAKSVAGENLRPRFSTAQGHSDDPGRGESSTA